MDAMNIDAAEIAGANQLLVDEAAEAAAAAAAAGQGLALQDVIVAAVVQRMQQLAIPNPSQPIKTAAKPPILFDGSKKCPPAKEWLTSLEYFFLANRTPRTEWSQNAITYVHSTLQTLLKTEIGDPSVLGSMAWEDFSAKFFQVAASVGTGQTDVERVISVFTYRPDITQPVDSMAVMHAIETKYASMDEQLPDKGRLYQGCSPSVQA